MQKLLRMEAKEKVEKVLRAMDPKLSIHDFRMVPGTDQINLIFDLVVPFEYDEEEESYGCQFYFDEDDIARASLYGDRYICPHFQYKDEYRIVRKQI